MIPIFFPATYISPSTLNICQEWFDQIIVYQASEQFTPDHYQNNQRLIIKTPLASQFDTQKFKQEILYLNALTRESGQNLDHLKARPEEIPFFDESSVNRIRAQIKQNTHQHEQADNKQLLFALYCQLFQDLDMQQEDVNRTFAKIENSYTKLFQDLDNDLSNSAPQYNNYKKVMTHISERLRIFFNLYNYDQEKSSILVTNHHDVIYEIQEWNDEIELVYHFEQSQMANAKLLLQEDLNIQIHQLSCPPVKTKNIFLYHLKNQLVGSFMPSDVKDCGNIRIIVLD
jgi:hypothetical protein